MEIADQKQITREERDQINQQVKTDLVDHLYQGCLPGTVSGIAASIALFFDYYGYTPIYLLIGWMIVFNLMMLSLSGLYFFYTKYKSSFDLLSWEKAYSVMMTGCAIAWVPGIYLLPENPLRQYLALLALFMATTGYATGTIGQFKLCLVTLNIILMPLVIWCFLKGGIFYHIVAAFSLIYMFFMLGINHRSTQWFIDSIKLKLENTLVSYQANHDLLTNLPNQRVLPQYIESAIQHVKEKNSLFALICFSLNRMEIINDSLGHHAGDEVIQSVANRLRSIADRIESVKMILTISRKDTFNILLVPFNPDTIEENIAAIFSSLDDPFFLETKSVKLSASIGVSLYPKDGVEAETLLSNADAAMLRAKQSGGNKSLFYTAEINAQLPKQLEIESDLHHALKDKQLQVYYQPLIDLHTGRIASSEALLRWLHPTKGFIAPVNFIPLAEETGIIVPIGAWALEEACRQTREWQKMGFPDLKVAVNVAEKQLRQEGFIEVIKHVLKVTDFDPNLLELELTETAILDESTTSMIKEFTRMGIHLAVDDFGTGYSGLSYLKRFSIDKLKIDQSFIRDIPVSQDSMTIVSAILAMAKELDIYSLAEGVETEEQLQYLHSKGCDYIQGYYFSKPLEASYFTQLLLTHQTMAKYSNLEPHLS